MKKSRKQELSYDGFQFSCGFIMNFDTSCEWEPGFPLSHSSISNKVGEGLALTLETRTLAPALTLATWAWACKLTVPQSTVPWVREWGRNWAGLSDQIWLWLYLHFPWPKRKFCFPLVCTTGKDLVRAEAAFGGPPGLSCYISAGGSIYTLVYAQTAPWGCAMHSPVAWS